MAEEKKDYGFREWQNIGSLELEWLDGLRVGPIMSIADTYRQNIQRIVLLPHIVNVAFAHGSAYGRQMLHAQQQVYGMDAAPDGSLEKRKMHLELCNLIDRGEYNAPPGITGISWPTSKPFEMVNRPLGKQLESFMYLYLVSTWAAFEAMTGDLWETAVNIAPSVLCPNEKGVLWGDVREVTKNSFDLKGKVGTVWRRRRNFTILKNIREHYAMSFTEHADLINKALNDPAIDALATARNVIVHKAAIIDEEYADGAKRSLGLLPSAQLGQPLPIDGFIVSRLVCSVRDRGLDLIRAVHSWLLNHLNIKPNA